MAGEERKSPRPRNRRRVKIFFLNGKLYKVLKVIRAMDLVECWNYPDSKMEVFCWSDVRKKSDKAFTFAQACSLIERHRITVERYILDGSLPRPQKTYALDFQKLPGKYYVSEKDIMEWHDFFLTVHRGRPRRDGRVIPGNMPSKAELRALMRHDTVMYVQTEDGEFVPAWKEVEW